MDKGLGYNNVIILLTDPVNRIFLAVDQSLFQIFEKVKGNLRK
jgi:hypothetical protein